jgi:hypothetical protein
MITIRARIFREFAESVAADDQIDPETTRRIQRLVANGTLGDENLFAQIFQGVLSDGSPKGD